jgi:hypothetical protein
LTPPSQAPRGEPPAKVRSKRRAEAIGNSPDLLCLDKFRPVGFGIGAPGYNARPVIARWLAALTPAFLLLLALSASPARGESSLAFSPPEVFGDIAAETYDEQGHKVGGASLRVERLATGNIRMEVLSGIDGSAQFTGSAELAPNGADGSLRLVRESTQALDRAERALGVTIVDHLAGFAQCGKPEGSSVAPMRIDLPVDDRVVSVPLNLLFQPLVSGEAEVVDFQVLLCQAFRGARIVGARARVVDAIGEEGHRIVEIRYGLDFGPLFSRLAAPLMPQLSFWFDENSPGAWVGHRMPLFSRGPTVVVVRSGFAPNLFGTIR